MQRLFFFLYFQIRILRPIYSFFVSISYFVVRCSLIPICLGISASLLYATSIGFIWISIIFTLLTTKLFEEDWKDGTLEHSYCYFFYLSSLALCKSLPSISLTIIWSFIISFICMFFYEIYSLTFIFHLIIGSVWIVQICTIQSSLTCFNIHPYRKVNYHYDFQRVYLVEKTKRSQKKWFEKKETFKTSDNIKTKKGFAIKSSYDPSFSFQMRYSGFSILLENFKSFFNKNIFQPVESFFNHGSFWFKFPREYSKNKQSALLSIPINSKMILCVEMLKLQHTTLKKVFEKTDYDRNKFVQEQKATIKTYGNNKTSITDKVPEENPFSYFSIRKFLRFRIQDVNKEFLFRKSQNVTTNYSQNNSIQLGCSDLLSLPILIPGILIVSHSNIPFLLFLGYHSFITAIFFLFVPKILKIVIKFS